jgi:sugar phosphate isomerase/epimerase
MRRYRLGATSFVHPAGWAENVARLAGRVEDVELLFFEADALPDRAEIAELAAWRSRGDLTYSLHAPLSARLASADEAARRAGVAEVLRALEVARPLAAEHVVVHVEFPEGGAPPDPAGFQRSAARSLEAILSAGLAPRALCVETLDYDLALLEPVLVALGVSVAVDLGHAERDGRSPLATLERWLPRARVVHWHGVEPGGRDHRSLAHVPAPVARAVLASLDAACYDGVLTLEVFREDDLEESASLVRRWLGER